MAKPPLSTAVSRPDLFDLQTSMRQSRERCAAANDASLYAPIALELVWQWSRGETGASEIRALLDAQQKAMKDDNATSSAWHTWIECVKSSIKPYGLVLKSARNWRSGKGIFEIVEASTVASEREAEEKRQADIDAIDQQARALATRQALLDLSVDQIVEQVWRLVDDTSASRAMILEALAKAEGLTIVKPQAAPKRTSKPQAAPKRTSKRTSKPQAA